jgi:NitT/TauT family transport system permease protein
MTSLPLRALPLPSDASPSATAAAPATLAAVPAPPVPAKPGPASVTPATAPALSDRLALLASRLGAQAGSLALATLSLGGVLLFWHLATTYRWDFYIRFTNLPTPAEVAKQFQIALASDKYATNVGISLRRIAIGFLVATALGVALGLVIGRYRRLRELLFPAFEALRPIPAIAWVPISIMLWPDNEVSIVFITFIGAFFPILLNTVSGVQAVDTVLLRAGQCLGAREPHLMWHVVLPGAAPQIFTGLAVGMGVAWVSLIAAEMISGQFGVGYFTWESYSLIAYPDIVLGMITIGVLGLGCSWLIRLAGRIALPWLEFSKMGGRS